MFTIVLVILIPFVINDINRSQSEIWASIENREWENFDSFAGTGMYFYEENNKKYCLFMLYGSGVYVAGHHRSEVKLVSDSTIEIVVPKGMVEVQATDEELQKYNIELMQGRLIINEKIYEASEQPGKYKYAETKV